jgi:hypothetical protein
MNTGRFFYLVLDKIRDFPILDDFFIRYLESCRLFFVAKNVLSFKLEWVLECFM